MTPGLTWSSHPLSPSTRQHKYYIYFTDPIYGFLENKRFYDDPYTDESARELGTGFKGVYWLDLRNHDVILIDATLSRPNGIQIAPNGTQVSSSPGPTQVTIVSHDSLSR